MDKKEKKRYSIPEGRIKMVGSLKWSVIIMLFLSLIVALMGAVLVALFYFDLLYTISENRIIEFADPWISKTTMPIIIIMAIDGLVIFICSMIFLIFRKQIDKKAGLLENTLKIIGCGSLILFPIGTLIGVLILKFLFSKDQENESEDQNDSKSDKNGNSIITSLFLSSMIYRIIIGTTLFSIYHVFYVIPYEHLGSDLAPTIRMVWKITFALDVFWLTLGGYSLFLYLLMKKNPNILRVKPFLKTLFVILNILCIPIGTMMAINLKKYSSLLDDKN